MSDLRSTLTDRAYAAGWRVVRGLPERTARRLFDAGGDWAGRRANRAAHRSGTPDQLRRNLSRVLGVEPMAVPDELVRDSMRSYARYWREAFRLPTLDHATLARSPLMPPAIGIEHVDAALARGRGVVLVLPHSGNWDMAGVWLVQHYGTFATVAERLQPESLFDRFVAYRESLGFEVFPLTGGEQPPFPQLADRLRRNGIVCLMGERDLTGKGVRVTFFGERTWMPAGAAKLAIETGAALLPVHAWYTVDAAGREGWGLRTDAPLDVSAGVGPATQALADWFATHIARHPADWHMLQPLWEADLSEARRARIAAAQAALGAGDPAGAEVIARDGAAAGDEAI
ncbi:phosphatidylinositol mannoside acyltransferase [Nocardia blacklockiae]|uniref:phosphatidylinositol mannoside acyltransferase n=1 Tax=Nocardia blacklockiae TaxID=480036 RepID=UPI0018958EB2|nr:phosphatidylinositol mannoside acyltransferase [Nocardia blacklockiae]MBF6170210.1 phosphatidylinositol mannoside acyltransferase [Nocardia blacklockiae]